MEAKKVEKEKTELCKWMDAVPSGDVKSVKAEIIRVCIVKDNIFRNWKSGATEVSPLEKKTINEVSKAYNGTNVFKLEEDDNTTET